MVASQANMQMSPGEVVLEIAARMEALATDGAWDKVEHLAVRLRAHLLDVPELQRRDVVYSVARILDRVKTTALTSRHDVTDKLTDIRRGQVATRAYGRTSGPDTQPVLR